MANRHFAKFADIWKHLPLVEVLTIERPEHYWESHAGSAFYPLRPSPERAYGIYYFLSHTADSRLAGSAYERALARLPHRDGFPIRYPGSAALAMLTLGAGARYLLCDRDQVSADDLERAAALLNLTGRVNVVRKDGPATVWAAYSHLPAAEAASVLCHIDPFDSFAREPGGPSSIQLFERLARGGVRTIYWYAYEGLAQRGWLKSQLDTDVDAWFGDILLPERDESGLIGLGVALANVSQLSIERCAEFGKTLERVYDNAPLPSGARGSIQFTVVDSRT